jgi:hypothetical protein
MLDTATIQSLAAELREARRTRQQVRHFSRRFPGMTVEDGYAIQRAWVALEIAAGRSIRGRKIGLTSRAMQLSSQIDEPDYAPLMDDMFFAQGGDIAVSHFIAPRVEVELAFVLGQPLEGPNTTLVDVLRATDYVCPALVRPRDQGPAQGVRHHLRLRRECRHRNGWPAGQARCGGPALGGRDAVQERRDRGNRPGRRGAEPPRHGRGLAGQQDRAARRAAERR